MSGDYRTELFETYDRRTELLDAETTKHGGWFAEYARRNYLPHLEGIDRRQASLLEIGCSKGLLLSVLRGGGFVHLEGIDLSPGDIVAAQQSFPDLSFACIDATEHLSAHPSSYDVIIMKAVLEHVPKTEVLPLVRLICTALRPRGIALIDVPNMDWLFAGHERYMDFTHEVGFTVESLAQVMGSAFGVVQIHPIDNDMSGGIRRLRTRAGRLVLGTLLSWADPDGAHGPIWCRSLVGVGRR